MKTKTAAKATQITTPPQQWRFSQPPGNPNVVLHGGVISHSRFNAEIEHMSQYAQSDPAWFRQSILNYFHPEDVEWVLWFINVQKYWL